MSLNSIQYKDINVMYKYLLYIVRFAQSTQMFTSFQLKLHYADFKKMVESSKTFDMKLGMKYHQYISLQFLCIRLIILAMLCFFFFS